MTDWLAPALAYIPDWLSHQLRQSQQPGCVIAIAHRGELVLERAFGSADLASGEALTPRHRFRIASHSKSFTAAGILRLREAGRLTLDDAVGKFVPSLHPDVAAVTLSQLLSHTAGITRDGSVQDQFGDRRPFASAAEILADLADGPTITPNTRFKYSNHGFALAGLAIEAITGESFGAWISREVIAPFGLTETTPDMPIPPGTPFARGHTMRLPVGRRLLIPGENPANAVAPAGGFVSTAADLARFYARLSPEAADSPLSAASRREMARRQWRNPHTSFEMWYGLGTISGSTGGWEWFGHSGRLQGYVSRTSTVPAEGLTVSVLINSSDGLPDFWLDGALRVLQAFRQRGAPDPALAEWRGRWWTQWGAIDLLPAGNRVLMAQPAFFNPLMDAAEIEVTGPDEGRIALAAGFGSHGERVRLLRGADGAVAGFEVGGARSIAEAELAAEMTARYGP